MKRKIKMVEQTEHSECGLACANIQSAVTAVILLGVNVLVFYIYIKLADDLQLRRMTSVYEQQLDLCERHQ